MNTVEKHKVNVLVLTTSYPLSKSSVSGTFIENLISSLPESCKPTVLTPSSADINAAPRMSDAIDIVMYRYAPRCLEVLAHRPGGIPAALHRNKFLNFLVPGLLVSLLYYAFKFGRRNDVLHANWAINGLIAGLAARALHRPLVTTLRGDDVTRAKDGKIDRAILYLSMYLSDRVITVSSEMRDWLREEFPNMQSKITLIENGVNEKLLQLSLPRTRDGRMVRLITVGSLIPRKGVDVILRALSLCTDKSRLHLDIVGDGMEEDRLRALANEVGVIEYVTFHGKVDPGKIATMMECSDVFILASHNEGRPNVVLESMAAGMAVIASDIGGVRELIISDQSGLLFPDSDSKMLAKHIEKLARDFPLRDRLGKNARSFIVDNALLWTRTGMMYCQTYHQLVQRK